MTKPPFVTNLPAQLGACTVAGEFHRDEQELGYKTTDVTGDRGSFVRRRRRRRSRQFADVLKRGAAAVGVLPMSVRGDHRCAVVTGAARIAAGPVGPRVRAAV